MDISELKKDAKADETRVIGDVKTDATTVWAKYKKQIIVAAAFVAIVIVVLIVKH